MTVAAGAPALETVEGMRQNEISCIPVVNGARLAGMIIECGLTDMVA